jgi:predicted unusual protein kinase regulating ubiquinone biosynthesis (AarF/ABC1/UbiB family)
MKTDNTTISSPRPSAPRFMQARYVRVTAFFAGVVLNVLWWDIFLRRVGLRRLSRRTAPDRYQKAAKRFRALATKMGGVWIKLGQFLSSRLDVLPESITSELAGLQDEVAPVSFESIRQVIETAFGKSVDQCFSSFEHEPLASASLGQVHRASLPGGECVVVKVQRPHIHDLLRVDLSALKTVIGWLKRYPPITRRANLDALFGEFSKTLWEEVDYLAEAENARRFGEMFAEDASVRIPEVYASHTTLDVLTLEDVYFIKITDYNAIDAAGVDRAEVADRLFRIYLRQIFVEGFFHADPHPGNLFVEPLEDGGWRLIFVDFGMVGRLMPKTKQGLRDVVIAVGTRDIERLMLAYQTLGVLLPSADLARIQEAEAALFEQLWGKSMRELVRTHPQEMRRFAGQFRDVLYEMPFQIPDNLIFFGRCVSILSGMCTGLNPEFNLFEGLRPFAEGLLQEDGGDWLGEIFNLLVEQARALSTLPSHLESTLARIDRGDVTVVAKAAPELQGQLGELTRMVRRLMGMVFFAALLITAGMFYVNGEHTVGTIGFGLALLALIWVIVR